MPDQKNMILYQQRAGGRLGDRLFQRLEAILEQQARGEMPGGLAIQGASETVLKAFKPIQPI